MRSGPAAESTPAPESDPARSDPAPEPGMPPNAQHPGESATEPAANTPSDPDTDSDSNAAAEADAPESNPEPGAETAPESNTEPESGILSESESDAAPESDSGADAETVPDADATAGPGPVPADSTARPTGRSAPPSAGLTGGIGCAALLLPLIAVAGAVLCFAAGVLSTATGCSPNGSALCSANGAWYAFALPVFVSPLIAAATAIGAVTVRRHRSTWLAVGYGVVFISIIIGLATASTGSN
jgi:hypothetical protein